MKTTFAKKIVIVLGAAGFLLGTVMCGGESSAPAADEETLSSSEETALVDEYALEALEKIDETNAEAEAEKIAKEIEADVE